MRLLRNEAYKLIAEAEKLTRMAESQQANMNLSHRARTARIRIITRAVRGKIRQLRAEIAKTSLRRKNGNLV